MVKPRVSPTMFFIFLFFLLASGLAFGKETRRPQAPKVAISRVAPHVIAWEPLIDYESVALRVSGEGRHVFSGEFAQGVPLFFEFYDEAGNALPDGTYKYELRASPRLPAEFKEAMAAARQSGDEGAIEEALRKAGIVSENYVQSGSFTLLNGQALDPEEPEAARLGPQDGARKGVAVDQGVAPQVVLSNGDGVIRNSLCVGFDCPDSPLFDDSTILLMENNTRIKFGDTSNAPFPNNDWEIEANSNLSGGVNYLGFNDCGSADNDGGCAADLVFAVESGARQNALYVEGDGDIGIGTDNPVLDIHVVTGNTPSLRLDQDGSSGFAAQTWDIAGNEANFFVRDVTAGSRLPLRIRPGAPTSSIDIATDGDIVIGTAAPGSLTDGSNAAVHILRSNGDATLLIDETSATAAGRDLLEMRNNGGLGFRLLDNNNGVSYRFLNSGSSFQIVKATPAPSATVFSVTSGGNGNFAGNLNVTGNLTKGSGAFMIDHPLDPANKLLYHSFVESPDMLNIYSGNVVLDDSGEAWTELPAWFEALNKDFRYQLTPIGAPAPGLYVAEEIRDGRFKIAGGVAGAKVSWLITGIRHDRYAEAHRVPVEVTKPDSQRGTFVHPDLFQDIDASKAIKAAGETAPDSPKKGERRN